MKSSHFVKTGVVLIFVIFLFTFLPINANAWSNGGYSDNPDKPNYGTHDWIAQHALDFLPMNEKKYIVDNLNAYLYGTELPDNPAGYGDSTKHHVYYYSNGTLLDDVAATRAQNEYYKAFNKIVEENYNDAAQIIGAMTHYISDLAVFGNVMGANTDWGEETHLADYEKYVNDRTGTYEAPEFDIYLVFDGELENITAYQAALDLAYDTTFDVDGDYDCLWMDAEVGAVNQQPVINSISAFPTTVEPQGTSTINVDANDPEGDALDYIYEVASGTISGSGSIVTWTAPSEDGSYKIFVKVNDGELDSEMKSVTITVKKPMPSTDYIVINEFELNPKSSDEGNEWVELYNPLEGDIIIDNWKLKNNGGDFYSLSGSISAGEHKIITFTTQWLSNSNERVILLDANSQEIDATPIKEDNTDNEMTWQRIPDGVDTNQDSDWVFVSGTKGTANTVPRGSRAYDWSDSAFKNRVGESLNFAVNRIADVLHKLAWESGYANQPVKNFIPIADAKADKTEGKRPLTVSFTGSGTDSDGNIVSYYWDFGDDKTSSEQNPTHTYNTTGEYEVKLTVTDDDGATDIDTIIITVKETSSKTSSEDGLCGLSLMILFALSFCVYFIYVKRN